MTERPEEKAAGFTDPLSGAAQCLFGISYLFPYQRLVVANILEAAEASGVPLHWPEPEGRCNSPDSTALNGDRDGTLSDDSETAEKKLSDREYPGRQLVILPTGAGKSLCFQLPAMIMEGPTLVIYPILSLMADQERRLRERGFSPLILRGGQTGEEREEIWKQLDSGNSQFIIANPEVLLTRQVMSRLEKIKVTHIVIDEAHCVSEWGESFRPAYLEINTIIQAVNAPLVTAFTATASAPVLEKIKKYIFGDSAVRKIVGNPDRANITYAALGCMVRDLAVRDILVKNARPAIVFCSSRSGAEQLARSLRNELGDQGLSWHREIRFYHAGLSREEKAEVEKWFLHNAEAVLVSTCAFGMGVDKADVRMVIHRDCPPSVEAYLQESGRAGRDGLQSKAILLWGPDDEGSLRRAKTETGRKRIASLLDYARNTTRCRREALLEMLNYEGAGESPEFACCDICEKQANANLWEEASLSNFFRRNNRCYTINEAPGVLAKAKNIRWTEEEARQAIEVLVKAKKLKQLKNPFWKDQLVPR
jgi:ATP-dependent DNA helicase RecQ